MNDHRSYYKKKLSFILFLFTIALSVHGLFLYYQPRIERPWQLISAVLYGSIKMFLFVAPLPAEADTALSYEIAKWLAPFLTSALVLTKLTNVALHFKNSLWNRMSKKHVVLFEKNHATDALIQNLLQSEEGYRISLVVKDPISDEWKNRYEKSGVCVSLFHVAQAGEKEMREMIGILNLNRAYAMIFQSQDDLENYACFSKLLTYLSPKTQIGCFLRCESDSMPLYLEDILHREKKRDPQIAKLDLMSFHEEELAVRMLADRMLQSGRLLRHKFEKMRATPVQDEMWSVERIDDALGELNLLVLGVNSLIRPLLKHLANDATVSIHKKTGVHIIDAAASEKMRAYLTRCEEIEHALELEISSVDPKSKEGVKRLKEISKMREISGIFLIFDQTVENLEVLKAVERYFPDIPKAIRNISGVQLDAILSGYRGDLSVFGDVFSMMSPKILIRSELDRIAKAFNQNYNRCMESAGLGVGSSWEELSQTKKNSSRASASHATIKEQILRALLPDRSDAGIKSLIDGWFAEFQQIEKLHKEHPERYRQELLSLLERNPVLDFLARLEHKRWCNSYYAMNFRYGEKKDEGAGTHPCLIDEWRRIITERFHTCHPEYDLIATFALFSKEDEDEARQQTGPYYG